MKVRLKHPLRTDGCDERFSLRDDRDYTVLAIECDWYRLLNEHGEPTLYDPACFETTDGTEPDFWFSEVIDGCRYAGPQELSGRGFFERWHEGEKNSIDSFRLVICKYYADSQIDLIPRRFSNHDG